MKYLKIIATICILLASYTTQAQKVFEMRTYHTNEGKMPDLLNRFENHTMKFFEKHNITNVGYWLSKKNPNTLVYIISYRNEEAVKTDWKAFVSDPAWGEVYKKSRENGNLIKSLTSEYLTATSFSPLK